MGVRILGIFEGLLRFVESVRCGVVADLFRGWNAHVMERG